MSDLNILTPIATAVIGSLIGYHVSRLNKLREVRIEFLIDAYRRLEKASSRDRTPGITAELEQAIADVQLLGSPEQVRLIQELAENLRRKKTDSVLNDLLADLRKNLRKELRLSALDGKLAEMLFIRFDA